MQFKYLSLMCLFFVLVIGCKKEGLYEGIYEGIMQSREQTDLVNPSNVPVPQERQSYDEYKRARAEWLKMDNEEKQ